MKNFCLLFFLILSSVFIKAQSPVFDTIAIEKRMLSANLDYQGKSLSLMKLEDLCKPYSDANDELLIAKRNNNPALLLTLAGAVMIGYSGVKWLMGDDFQWYYAAGGVAMIGVTIPLYIGARNHTMNAARIFNYETKHKQLPKP